MAAITSEKPDVIFTDELDGILVHGETMWSKEALIESPTKFEKTNKKPHKFIQKVIEKGRSQYATHTGICKMYNK